ncbi:hypothetical protein F5Y19DRAFT_154173 [Xylariaceae sp. FL1651]|nr:hypothetical protein F5Y19DRAFT_154173 [Xylariaceae sp. FL1651]
MNYSGTPLLRRPNGRPQACEPCRKRKVACDHSQPICNRCKKRRQAGDCVYVVSKSSRSTPANRLPPSPASSASSMIARSCAAATERTEPRSPDGQGARPTASGYLGFTSFSAVYEETQISLSRLQGSQATPSELDDLSQEPTVRNTYHASPSIQEACLYVLRNVPEPSRGKICLRGSHCGSWVYFFLDRVLESFYEKFGDYFGPNRNDKSLIKLACTLSRNTTLLFCDDDDILPSRWIAQFSGSNARWETLGLLFSFWDFSVNSITIKKSVTQDEYGRPSQVTMKCLDFCVQLCQEFSPANSMFLFISYRRLIMETTLNGDLSRQSWMYLGEVVSLLTFLGYHVLPDSSSYEPKFSTEIKRRIYYHVYITHMTLVSLTGRPPLMSKRYSTTPLPLDFGNSTLYSDEKDALLIAMDNINAEGWDKCGRRFSGTPMRARAKLALLREEIMHFALSTKENTSIEALLDVKARELRTVEEFPAFVRYQDFDLDNPSHEVGVIFFKLLMRLEHQLNMFFIERLLHRHGHSQSELLSISFDMVYYTLPFWTHQDRFLPLRGDCEWLIMAFGVPAGGILCQELLKPTLRNDPRITRSSLIQQLSLLVGFLDWIKPTAPNGDLCGKCKTIIKHVLDQALNPPATGYESADGAVPDWDFTTQVDFDFDLLDTFGWTRSEFSLSQQTNT